MAIDWNEVWHDSLSVLSVICGITYFLAWSASFYPQVYLNKKRKSVIGFSFDYLHYNVLGFVSYSIYNVSLFFIPIVKEQYEEKFGTSQTPVQFSDVLFAVHALCLVFIQASQCFIYERGNQYISLICAIIVWFGWLSIIIYGLLTALGIQTLLQYMYFFSYVKLFVTLVKYIPQVVFSSF